MNEWYQLAIQFKNQGFHYYKQSRYVKAAEMFEAGLVIAHAIGDRNGEVVMLDNLGDVYIKLGHYNKAVKMFEIALKIARETENRKVESSILGNLGNVYMDIGQCDKAAKKYEAAIETARKIGDRKAEGTWLGNLGIVYENIGEYDKAAKSFEAALKIIQKIGDEKGENTLLRNLGGMYIYLGQYNKATEKLEAALVIARKIGDRNGEGVALGNLGIAYRNLGQYDKAVGKLEAAIMFAREIGDIKVAGTWLGNLGNAYMGLGQYDKAAGKFEAALKISRKIRDRKGEGTWLGSLGIIYMELGQYDKAVEKLEVGLKMSREFGDRRGEGRLLNYLGDVSIELGHYDKATEKFEAAIEIAKKIGDRNGESTGIGNVGNAFRNIGKYDKAAEKYEAALKISQQIGDRKGVSSLLGNLGNVYIDLGQYDKAAKRFEAALEISRKIGDRKGEGVWLGNLGICFASLWQLNKAAEKLEAALVIARKIRDKNSEGIWLGSLGEVYANLGQYDKATEKTEAALEISKKIGDRKGEGAWLGSLGNVYMILGQYDKAARKYEAGLAITREVGDRRGEGRLLSNLGISHYAKSDNHQEHHKKAIDYLEESIHVCDELWMDIKKDDQKVAFDDVNGSSRISAKYLQSLYWSTDRFIEALVTCEHARSKSLELLLRENRKDIPVTSNDSWEGKNLSFVSLPPITNLEKKIRNVTIQHKSAIIVYDLHVDGDVLIWVIKSGNEEDAKLVHKKVHMKKEYKSLCHLVELTRRSLGARNRKHSNKRQNKARDLLSFKVPLFRDDKNRVDDFIDADLQAVEDELRKAQDEPIDGISITMENALRELYNLLILPIQDALVDQQRLTIVPFGDLFALPFAALVDQNGKYLIEKHTLSFAPSIGTLVELEQNHSKGKKEGSTVIVGTGAKLSGARSEAKEVHNIVTINGQREAKKFIGNEATKEAVMDAMKSADIIHLATHGSKDGILLSGPTGEDIKLTMGEVQSLDLKGTQMVVLSACDTFKGDLRTDGVVGITRSFLAAGSSTVIASLWPVGDESTKEMMIRLYQFLFREDHGANDHCDGQGDDGGSVDISYALQQVMIGMLKEKFAIKQWAPFLVYGLNTSLDHSLKQEREKRKYFEIL